MLTPIRAILFDIDGVLTDGRIIYDNGGNEWKNFHVRDGMLVSRMLKLGYYFGAISGRESSLVARRMKELEIAFVRQQESDKLAAMQDFAMQYGLPMDAIAYIGDDLNDLPALKAAAFATCPADAPIEVKRHCHQVLQTPGGQGVLREMCERLLKAHERWEEVVESFG